MEDWCVRSLAKAFSVEDAFTYSEAIEVPPVEVVWIIFGGVFPTSNIGLDFGEGVILILGLDELLPVFVYGDEFDR